MEQKNNINLFGYWWRNCDIQQYKYFHRKSFVSANRFFKIIGFYSSNVSLDNLYNIQQEIKMITKAQEVKK